MNRTKTAPKGDFPVDHLTLQKSRQMAEAWLDDQQHRALAAAPDEETRRLLKTLYARQKGSLEYLGMIRLDAGVPRQSREEDEPETWLQILAHPLADLLLMVAVLTFALLGWKLATVAAAILATLHVLLRITHPALRRKPRAVLPEVHEPYIPEADMDRFLRQQAERIRIDAASIAERQGLTLVRERQNVGEDAVELYCALHEASLDIPDPQLLAYPLSMLRMTLQERGLEPVPYAPETAALFDVMPADCPEGMRWPAIRMKDSGVILKRGLYLRHED